MKRTIGKFFSYFVLMFLLLVVVGWLFIPSDLNATGLIRAIVISFGTAFGYVLMYRRNSKK